MGFIKDKNLIKYTGRTYEITYNFTDGTLTTNHPRKEEYIEQTVKNNWNSDLAKIIGIAVYNNHCYGALNPFIETIVLQAPKFLRALANAPHWIDANKYIKMAKKEWKYILQIEQHIDGIGIPSLDDWVKMVNGMKLNLNYLETKWFQHYPNAEFVKHFAGQLEMYQGIVNHGVVHDIIEWYNENKIDIKPFLKNKNLLQTLKDLQLNKKMLYEKEITDGITQMCEKYKYIEQTDADGWKYQLLKNREDFAKEAIEMNNCLHRMEYDIKMSKGKCIIVVATATDGKRIDMELAIKRDGTLKMYQAYYKNDRVLTTRDENHLKKWVDGINCLKG